MTQYIDILVDGVLQQREAYVESVLPDSPDYMRGQIKIRPHLKDNEHLREVLGGHMEIITFPKP